MVSKLEYRLLLLATLGLIAGAAIDSAFAVSVEVAKKCEALTTKAYPPREIGNPAAGSAKGNGRSQQEFFRKCLANEGKRPVRKQ